MKKLSFLTFMALCLTHSNANASWDDAKAMYNAYSACRYHVIGNQRVNFDDFGKCFFSSERRCEKYDTDSNGYVDFGDLNTLSTLLKVSQVELDNSHCQMLYQKFLELYYK